jgi:hypothetical protein
MPAPDSPSPLQRPAFLHYLFARISASLAFQIVSVAVGWQIYALSGSALDLGLIGLAQFLPMAALTLVVGHVADRYDRRKIVAVCMALEALATLVLAIAALHGVGGKTLIYATIIIMSSARAFEAPTLATLIPAVVPREWLPRATALASSGGQIAQIAGPALGGVGYGLGAGWIYCVAAALYLSAFASIATLVIERAPPRKEPTTWRTLFAGITFIFQRRLLLGTRGHGATAHLRQGHPERRPLGARRAARRPRLRRRANVLDAGAPEPGRTRRPLAVRRADRVRAGDHGVRPVDLDSAVHRRAGGAGSGGRGQRGGAFVAGAAEHARPYAGPRQRGEHAIHRHVQPAGRIRVRRHGRGLRRGAGGGDRRGRHHRRGGVVDAVVSGAEEAQELARALMRCAP